MLLHSATMEGKQGKIKHFFLESLKNLNKLKINKTSFLFLESGFLQ
jgi:hypothetical protein